MRLQFQLAAKADVAQVTDLPRTFGLKPQSYWDNVNGTASTPQSARLALIASTARNIQSFGKLGGATVSSITDLATYAVSTHFNKLPYWDAIANIGKVAASKEQRDWLTVHGIIAESMAGDMNRWFTDNIKAGWSGRLAQATMKLSLLNAWSDTLRRAFSLTMMQGLARDAGKDWAQLGQWTHDHFAKKGITAEDWDVIRRAQLTNFRGVDHLTPESIHATGDPRAAEVVSKVLGFIQDESEYAVMNPDLATKSMANWGGLQRGTVPGEIARSVMQFKSFPIAMISRHWRRMMDIPVTTDGSAPGGLGGPQLVNRLAYGGAMMVTTTALGMIAYQAKQVLAGKDPAPMVGKHAGKTWIHAVTQGGGLSIAGDMLLNDSNDNFGDWAGATAKTALGPTAGTAFDALKIPKTNIDNKLDGKPTHTAAQTLQFARSNAPFLGLWYAKAAVDHAGMQALQENLSPGYLGRMRQRAMQDGQRYWWSPGSGGPQRAPDLGKAVGQ
jgi:hypothetical protein